MDKPPNKSDLPAQDHRFSPKHRRCPQNNQNQVAKTELFENVKNQSQTRCIPDFSKQRKNEKRRQKHWSELKNINPLYAALDLGTNNCRLLIVLPQQKGYFRVVDTFSRIVRLGEGLESSGRLKESAMRRTIEVLGECAIKLQNPNIRKMRLIATEACRRAENGKDFLQRVEEETGLKLEIINCETEACLVAEGCSALIDKKADGAILFDIGGGSSELVLLDRRNSRNKNVLEQISSWVSLPVGVITLSENYGGRDISQAVFNAMTEEARHYLKLFESRETPENFRKNGYVHLLGASGTATTLAAMHMRLPFYDRRKIDGVWMNDGQIDETIERLLEMNYRQRVNNPCIGPQRADLILAGCAILQAIRATWPFPWIRVADRGLREGMLTRMIDLDKTWIV